MDIWSADKLTLFIAFFLPGFISMQIYRLFIAGDDSDIVKKLPAIISYSSLHYLVFGWILLINTGRWLIFWSYIVVLFFPIIWPFVILLIRDNAKWWKIFWPPSGLVAAMLKPEATPWDRVLTNRQRFIRVTLKDGGGFVGGFLAGGSEVSTYPNDQQIFIRNEHTINASFEFRVGYGVFTASARWPILRCGLKEEKSNLPAIKNKTVRIVVNLV